MDTFQTAGGEWADPTTASGLINSVSREQLDRNFQFSLDELSRTIPKDKIYLLQVSDAYRPKNPIARGLDINETAPRGKWNH